MLTAMTPSRRARISGAGFAMLLWVLIGANQTMHAEDKNEALVVTVENDVFTGSDSNYTNGVSVNWSSDDLSKYGERSFVSGWANLFDFAPGFDANGDNNHLLFSFIHEMNTPTDITIPDPPLSEQPYSGILLLDTSLYTNRGDVRQSWNIRVGAVGPITQADHVQIQYHEWIGADEPLGWDTQLPNEFIFNVGYMRADEWMSGAFEGDTGWRISSVANLELGTYATVAGAGAILEIGRNLDETVSTTSLGAGLGSFVGMGADPAERLELSAFAGVTGYAVGHYLPLDGTVFRDSRSAADTGDFFGQVGLGVSARYQNLIASFGVTFAASPESGGDVLDVGALSIGWVF